MRKRPIRLAACTLLSLLLVFSGAAVFRHEDRRLPLNPIAAAETITAADHTHEETTKASESNETTAPARNEPTTRSHGSSPGEKRTEPITAFSRGSSAAVKTNEPNGASNGGDKETASDHEMSRASGSGFTEETTTAESKTERAATPEPTTAVREPTTEEKKREPVIVTDLTDCLKTQSELPDGTLRFYAYLDGDTAGYGLRVRLTRADGSRTLLQPRGTHYAAPLSLGVHHITMTIISGGETVSFREFTVEIAADKATEEHPTIGDEPPVIETNLDGWTDEIVNSRFAFKVTARTAGGAPIHADGVEVRLDGDPIRDPTGSRTLEYALFFHAPNVGERERHTVTVLAWDGKGNSSFKSYSIVYRHVSDGDLTGEITVILDATTVGLGVLDAAKIELHQGENSAQLLLRVLDDFDYTYDYAGSEQVGFYLRRIARDGMCDGAQVPERLWTMIQRDGLKTTAQHDRDSLGEHDYTQGSGWMFSVNDTLFPGKGMERTFLDPGDTLRVCFTLSYGKDVGGFDSSGAGMGSLSGYCGIWRGGEYLPLTHHWSEPNADGCVVCAVCHESRKEGEDA